MKKLHKHDVLSGVKIVNTEHQWYEMRCDIAKGKFGGCIIKEPKIHKNITFLLVKNNLPFERINYGAGVVKLIPNDGQICEHCQGKGLHYP